MGSFRTMDQLVFASLSLVTFVSCFPFPQSPSGPLPIPRPGSDGSYGGDNYFQYINVPAHKTYEWGYRRGNPDHNREEYLSQKDHTFKAKLKWADAYGGQGEHYYDYNHGPAVYKGAAALQSEQQEQYVESPPEARY